MTTNLEHVGALGPVWAIRERLGVELAIADIGMGAAEGPAEGVAACMRVVNMTAEQTNPQWYMDDMGQQLFEPPNVSGWQHGKAWVTSALRSECR